MQNNQVSPLLQNQLIKQKNLSDFARTNDEMEVASAMYDSKLLRDCENDMEAVVDAIATWAYMVGAPNLSPQEMILLSKHLITNFGNLTINEIGLAANLSLRGVFNCEVKCFRFSPLYCSTILNEFMRYRGGHLQVLFGRWDATSRRMLDEIKPTPQEKRDLFIECLRNEYGLFRAEGTVYDGFNIIYNHLNKTKRLKLTGQEIEEAMEYGRKMYVADLQKKAGQSLYDLAMRASVKKDENEDKKAESVKKFARKYTLIKFFSKTNIDELVESITTSEFTQ